MRIYRYGLLGVLLAGNVLADEAAQRYGCERPIRVAMQENVIAYRDGKGFEPDFIAELQKRSGCTFEARLIPRSAAWEGLADGSLDMVATGVPTVQRRQLAYFVPSLFYRNKLIVSVALAPRIVSFTDFQNIPDVHLGALRGLWNGPYYEGTLRMLKGMGRVHEYSSDAERFAALRSGEVSAVIAHDMNLNLMLPLEEQLRYRVLDLNPGPSLPVGMLLSRRSFDGAQAAAWLRLAETMRLDGGLARLIRKNMPSHLLEEFLHSGYRYDVSKRSSTP